MTGPEGINQNNNSQEQDGISTNPLQSDVLKREGLRHSSNEMVIGFTKSPEGKPCIGMTFSGEEWILYRTMRALIADKARTQLQKAGVESLPGAPFNYYASLREQRLILHKDEALPNKPVGIFIPADKFDSIEVILAEYVRNNPRDY